MGRARRARETPRARSGDPSPRSRRDRSGGSARPSWAVEPKRRSAGDGAAADDAARGEQDRELPGSPAARLLAEVEVETRMASRAGLAADLCRDGPRAVAQLDRVHTRPRTVQDGVAQRHPASRELRPAADRDHVRLRVGAEHVERLRCREADAAALPDREVVVAAVAPDPTPAGVEEPALAVTESAVVAQELALALAREEAEVLALGLRGHGEAVLGGDLAHPALLEPGERKAQRAEQLRRQLREHVALVLGGVRGRRQQGA